MKNYYYILGLQNNASEQDVRIAYKKLSMLLHPDRNGGDKFFEDRFKEIQEAYDTLSNASRRSLYDEELLGYSKPQNTSAYNSNPPSILQFEASKKAIAEGELVTIMWRVTNADSVHIDPLGLMEASGTKTIRLPNMLGRSALTLTLTATNTYVQKSQQREIHIQNKSFRQKSGTIGIAQPEEQVRTEPIRQNPPKTHQTARTTSATTIVAVKKPLKSDNENKRGVSSGDIYTYVIILIMAVIMIVMAMVVYQLNSAK
jgi:curved DNA-binding protein CbpA